jgi:RNA polymerase sigma factor (sigma-70 family)
MQTTFINAQKGLRRGVTPQFELAWLFKIARNVCYNARASASRRGRLEAARDLDALQDVLPTPDRDAGIAVSDLTAALGTIPERQRQALLLREFQGLSYEEIAAELGVSVAAVETLLFRARRSVADRLGQTGMRASTLTSLFGFLRWLLPGGAKVAAVAATATLAVTPGMHGPAKTAPPAAKVVPPLPTFVADAGAGAPMKPRLVEHGARVVRVPPTSPTKTSPPVIAATTATQTATGASNTASDAPKAVQSSAPPSAETPTPAPPSATTPELPVPPVNVPDLGVPDTQLPTVGLPPLPVDLPQLPAVDAPELQLP